MSDRRQFAAPPPPTAMDNLAGDADVDPASGYIEVDHSVPSHPVVRFRADKLPEDSTGGVAPSFTVVAADTQNSSFEVLRPYVYVAGEGEVSVGGQHSNYRLGDTVWCIVRRVKQSDGSYKWSAELADQEADGAYLCIKVAKIPVQYHVGAVIVGSPKVKSVNVVTSLEDASVSDSAIKMKYWRRSVDVMVSDESGSSSSSSSASVTIATLESVTYVTGSVYDPSSHTLRNQTRTVKAVVDETDAESSSASVFTAEPVCGG